MRVRKRSIGVLAIVAGAATAGSLLGGTPAVASSPAKAPVVVVHMSSNAVTVGQGFHRLHAGSVIFKVVSARGDHELQIARLHRGYSLAQAGADINKAFGGDVAAVRRVDANVTFRGGAEAHPNRPGYVAVKLRAGDYVFTDQDSNAYVIMHVWGTAPARTLPARRGSVTTFTYGFGNTPVKLPAKGWVHVNNVSDQPHFVVFNHVKANTTRAMVGKYFAAGSEAPPSFGLRASTSTGIISPNVGQLVHYNLPPGKYVIACFWPDDDTGMPHAMMGMWKLVWLK
jgi:hypothetical protein